MAAGNDFGFPSPAPGNLAFLPGREPWWARGLTPQLHFAYLELWGGSGLVERFCPLLYSLWSETSPPLSSLSPHSPGAAGAHCWGRRAGWLNPSEVSGTWARTGHAAPHSVPGEEEGQEGLRDLQTPGEGSGAYGDTSKKWVEQTSKAEHTLLIIADALGGDR